MSATVLNFDRPLGPFAFLYAPRPAVKPKRSRAKVRTIAEQRAYILSDKALTFNTTIYSAADGVRNARIDGRNVTLGR